MDKKFKKITITFDDESQTKIIFGLGHNVLRLYRKMYRRYIEGLSETAPLYSGIPEINPYRRYGILYHDKQFKLVNSDSICDILLQSDISVEGLS